MKKKRGGCLPRGKTTSRHPDRDITSLQPQGAPSASHRAEKESRWPSCLSARCADCREGDRSTVRMVVTFLSHEFAAGLEQSVIDVVKYGQDVAGLSEGRHDDHVQANTPARTPSQQRAVEQNG